GAPGAAGEEEDHSGDDREGEHGGDAEDSFDGNGVAAGDGVVVAAVEDQQVDGVADFVFGGAEEREAQIARGIVDSGEIFGHLAVGCGEHDDAGVGELVHLSVGARDADIVEAGGGGDGLDGRLLSGEEVYGGGLGGRVE